MPGLNRVQLIGYLGQDPEARFTPTGKQVVKFSLAVSKRWKKEGAVQEHTEWINILDSCDFTFLAQWRLIPRAKIF